MRKKSSKIRLARKKVKTTHKFRTLFKHPLSVISMGILGILLFMLVWQHFSKSALGASISSPTDTTITVNTTNTVAPLPSRYLGFSFEPADLCNFTGTWDTSSFEQLVKNLGAQVIRIGGNSADYALWSPTGQYSCSTTKTVLTQQLIDTFFALAVRINAKVMWSLNLGNYAPTTYSGEAAYVIKKGLALGGNNGSFLWALGIGNEPDLYTTNGLRPSTYNVSSYISQWNAYRNIIRQQPGQSHLQFFGPDVADSSSWFTTFISSESAYLSKTTHHFYAIHQNTITPGTPPQQIIATLLSSSLMQQTASTIDSWHTTSGSIPLVISETNSVTGGGYLGASNTFASALWGIDYIFTALEHGAKQMNFITNGDGAYTPISFNATGVSTPRPLYYALLLFKQAASSGNDVATSISTPYNVVAHSFVDSSGNLRVVVINKDLTNSSSVLINTNGSYTKATVMYLTASAANATSGITFGGQAVQANGTWNGTQSPLTLINGTSTTLTVSSASAALVTFTP